MVGIVDTQVVHNTGTVHVVEATQLTERAEAERIRVEKALLTIETLSRGATENRKVGERYLYFYSA